MAKRKFKFLYRSADRYYWECTTNVDSRTEQVSCSVAWYWGQLNGRGFRENPSDRQIEELRRWYQTGQAPAR